MFIKSLSHAVHFFAFQGCAWHSLKPGMELLQLCKLLAATQKSSTIRSQAHRKQFLISKKQQLIPSPVVSWAKAAGVSHGQARPPKGAEEGIALVDRDLTFLEIC